MTLDPTAGSPFEQIRHATPAGTEYWSARALARLLGYTEYGKFRNALAKGELACAQSDQPVADHFAHVSDMVEVGSGAQRKVADIHLSRYGCYLTIQNADPAKEIVALGQTYFAVQTRRAEQADELAGLTADQRRIYARHQLADHNSALFATARTAGVISPADFAIFQDSVYEGLYAGEHTADIHRRKGLAPKQKILDHMGTTELAANLFRATQAEEKIRREGVQGADAANAAHYAVGRKVRQTIAELGGTMPEDLPTPTQSIQDVERAEKRRLAQGPQLGMFDDEPSA
ncbi:MAG: DNA damage-inducible protein D [Chloroflexota bacterium]|nr:DNA damage-inducible protein D [Chloroflexota bacterium]